MPVAHADVGSAGTVDIVNDGLGKEIIDTMKCQKCNKREATENWVGEGSMMDFIHGFYARWCKICVLEAQIAHAENQIKNLQKLKKELEAEKRKE